MKKILIVFFGLILCVAVYAQIPVTPLTPEPGNSPNWDIAIPNDGNIPEEEQKMIMEQYRAVYDIWSQSEDLYSKGQTGHMLLDLFALEDTLNSALNTQENLFGEALQTMFESILAMLESFEYITDSVDNQYDLIDNLYKYLVEGYDDTLMKYLVEAEKNIYNNFYESQILWENTFIDGDSIINICKNRFDDVLLKNQDFVFRVGEVSLYPGDELTSPHFDTSEVAVIYDETYRSIDNAFSNMENGFDYLGAGLRSIFNDSLAMEGIDSLKYAMQFFRNVLTDLNNNSMWSFMDTVIYYNKPVLTSYNGYLEVYFFEDSVTFSDMDNALAELEEILNGKVYEIDDTRSFRPVGILENIPYGLYQTYIDMYSVEDPYTYDFRGIFPLGLAPEIIAALEADLVIDLRDNKLTLMSYLGLKRAEFDNILVSSPNDINAHIGRGYIDLFTMLNDLGMQVDQILELVNDGRIDSLFQNYNWMNLDYSDEIASIQYDLNYHMDCVYMDSLDYILFTILIKDPQMSSPGIEVAAGDMVYPIYIFPQISYVLVNVSYEIQYGLQALGKSLEMAYLHVDSLVDITLDPNLLNLADIEGPLDFIYRLQTANPDFGEFTPEGKEAFKELGMNLTEGMYLLCNLSDTLIKTMDYAKDLMYELGMTSEDYEMMMMNIFMVSEGVKMFTADMANPEIYSYVDIDTLNVSAWFDNVPDNLLKVLQSYLEGEDLTMAGFFPNGKAIILPPVGVEALPEVFALKSNYPNPFNPMTTIAFDIPESGLVNMSVYNLTGKKVMSLINEQNMSAGSYDVIWNASDFSSGLYIVQIQYGNEFAYRKMTLLK